MDKLHFFRAVEDPMVFPAFSVLHWVIILVTFGVCFWLWLRPQDLKKTQHQKIFEQTMFWVLLIEQLLLTFWFWFGVKADASRWLPLYTCRIAIWSAIIAYLHPDDRLKTIAIYWGLFGGITSTLYPDPERYFFPHVSNFAYFLGHGCLLWSGFYWMRHGYRFRKKQLLFMTGFTNVFLLFTLFVNRITGGNYNYLTSPPLLKEALSKVPRPLYVLLIFVVFNLLLLIIHGLGLALQKEKRPL